MSDLLMILAMPCGVLVGAFFADLLSFLSSRAIGPLREGSQYREAWPHSEYYANGGLPFWWPPETWRLFVEFVNTHWPNEDESNGKH